MATTPAEIRLTLNPSRRFEAIDVNARVSAEAGDVLQRYSRTLYCSLHTTAGYLDQSLAGRMHHHHGRLAQFFDAWHALFPPDADYRHDQMELRSELSDEQKETEPRNADSHLTFIGSGMRNCVTYRNQPLAPVYFIDLDGTNGASCRERQTTIVAYDQERVVARESFVVPVSRHPIDSVNLGDPRIGLVERVNQLLAASGLDKGRVDISLGPSERNVGLTVNEYETMLMRHDLVEVLKDPLKFAAQRGRHMIDDPLAIPTKTLNYAKYDFPRLHQLADGGAALGPLGARAHDGQADVRPGTAAAALAACHLPGDARRRRAAGRCSCAAPTRARSWCSGSRPTSSPAASRSRSSA